MGIKRGMAYVFISNIISLIISLFSGFVLPKMLSIDTYASIKLFQLYITYITVLHLGFSDGMYLRIGGKQLDKIDKKQMLEEFKTFKIFQAFVAIIAIVISIIIKNEILLFCSLVIIPINIGDYLRQVYQATGLFKKYSIFMNINTLLVFIVNLFLLFVIKTDNYSAYIIGYVLVYILYWILIEREAKKIFGKQKVKADIQYLSNNIKSGFLLLIGNFCNMIFTGIDRIFVQYLMGSIKFAFYSFAVGIENLLNVFVTPISTVMYNYLCNNNDKENVTQIKKIILLFSTAIIVVIFPAKFIIQNWIPKYDSAVNVLFILFAAQYITILVRCIHVNLYKVKRQQKRYFTITLMIVGISVLLNIIFYVIFKNIEAIAVATLITSIIWFTIGEIDFKEYRLKIKDYVYTFVILILFLVCGQIQNAILGGIIYIFMLIVSTILLSKETMKTILNFLHHARWNGLDNL